jgi:di/tricarboxylate transporter
LPQQVNGELSLESKIVFATGHVTAGRMAKVGAPLDIIGIILITILTLFLVPLLWT